MVSTGARRDSLYAWLLPAAVLGQVPAAITDPDLVARASDLYGAQAIVVAIDAKARADGSGWDVYSHGGRKNVGLDAVDWARRMAEHGAGEILLTSMDRDGTKSGFDLELTRAVSDAVPVPVIASGGVGALQHLSDGIRIGGADFSRAKPHEVARAGVAAPQG